MSRQVGRTRSVVTGTGFFNCEGCYRRRADALRTDTGFCQPCIDRGRRFWLKRMPLAELIEIAALVWPVERDEPVERAA